MSVKSFFSWAFKTSATIPLKIAVLFGYGEIAAPQTTNALLEQYEVDPWVYASVWITANTCARVPCRLRHKKTGKIQTEHKLLDLIRNPNPEQSGYDFMEELVSYLELAGEGFWEIVGNAMDVPLELYNMRPDRVKIIPRTDGKGIESYEFFIEGVPDPVPFRSDQVVPFRYFHPRDDWRGMSPLYPLRDTLVETGYANKWRQRFLKRYGTPEGALGTEQNIGQEEAKRMGNDWRQGFDIGGGTPLFTKGITWQQISQAPKPSGMFDLLKMQREEKLAISGVPPVKVGLLEFAKYANYDLQARAFYIDAITPKMTRIASVINLKLLPRFDKSGEWLFEFDTLTMTYADLSSLVGVLDKQFNAAALTPNEFIGLTGLGNKYPEGDDHFAGERKVRVTVQGTEPLDTAGTTETSPPPTTVTTQPPTGVAPDGQL